MLYIVVWSTWTELQLSIMLSVYGPVLLSEYLTISIKYESRKTYSCRLFLGGEMSHMNVVRGKESTYCLEIQFGDETSFFFL